VKFEFQNNSGQTLVGNLELPSNAPTAMAIFAHCFTCSKDFVASREISKSLTEQGIGVLRFDFTGLGNSEGDFANTNFSSNVEDLLCADQALRRDYPTPQILIGHSLGGAAVLKAASSLPEIKAVVTIAAPSSVDHVSHLFSDQIPQINEQGQAEVELEGRKFKIQKQFLDDIHSTDLLSDIKKLKKALQVMHSPVDNIVSIDHASTIFSTAKHPKSFISLDKANHLLTNQKETQYVARSIAGWVSNYVELNPSAKTSPSPPTTLEAGQVLVRSRQTNKFTQDIWSEHHYLVADEPSEHKGDDLGMNPYELLLAGLGACTSMTLRMYADHKGLDLDSVEVLLAHEKIHAEDCDGCETKKGKVDQITKTIKISGQLSPEEKKRIYEIAEKCPVNKTLLSEVQIKSEYE
jgi:uncharacterized OsmC-like protein/esterase/lipase